MYVSFRFLASCTSLDVLFYEFSESGTFILFAYQFPGVGNARMSCSRRVMKGLKNVMSKVWIVFKENFVSMCSICWSEEMIGEKNTWFSSIYPLVKVFSS